MTYEELPRAVRAEATRWDRQHALDTSALEEARRATISVALPEGVAATSIWPAWELDVLLEELRLPAAGTLVDVGCGTGDIGQWIARQAGVRLIGIDPSQEALRRAKERAPQHEYRRGHFTDTGLPADAADAVLVVDALHLCEDVHAAAADLMRIVRPGGRAVVVGPAHREFGRPAPVFDEQGWTVVRDEETADWRASMHALLQELVRRRPDLDLELGRDAAGTVIANVENALDRAPWHGLVVAERG